MTDEEGRRPLTPPPDGPGRRMGPYERSLREQSAQVARAVARRARRRRRNRVLAAVAAVAVLAGGAYGAMKWLGGSSTSPVVASTSAVPTHCERPNTVRLAVPATMGPALAEVTTTLARRSDGPCTTFELSSAESAIVSRTLATGARPDGWVTDSSLWLGQAQDAGTKLTPGEPFASSALVVAMATQRAQALQGAPTWSALTSGKDPVRFPNPNTSTEGLLGLSAVAAAVNPTDLQKVVAAAAQAPAATIQPASLAKAGDATAVPIAEAALVDFNRANPADPLAAVAPVEGGPPLEYSLLTTTDDTDAAASIKALSTYLASDEAKKILTTHGFKVPGAAEAPGAEPMVGSVKVTDPATSDTLAKVRSLWNAATPRRQVLLAVDVSAAMLDRTDQGTRLAVTEDAIRTALASLPDQARAALWVYSNHIGVQGDDFKAVTGYGAIGDPAQSKALEAGVSGLEKTVGGGRGLYDSILAAYTAARNAYVAGQKNVVVVIVNGPNDDDYGLDEAALRGKLTVTKDPARPVELVIVGAGSAPNAAVLKSFTAITGGRYVAAPEPKDLRPALVNAVTGS